MALTAIKNGFSKTLNVLCCHYPDELTVQVLSTLLQQFHDSKFILELLTLDRDALALPLRSMMNHFFDNSNFKLVLLNEINPFVKQVVSSNNEQIAFMVHNGEYHDDGQLAHAVISQIDHSTWKLEIEGDDRIAQDLETTFKDRFYNQSLEVFHTRSQPRQTF